MTYAIWIIYSYERIVTIQPGTLKAHLKTPTLHSIEAK